MIVAYKTDTGKKRVHNEDSILVDESANIYLLADGMGGHQAGEVASNLAVKECYACLKENYGTSGNGEDISNLLIASLSRAHNSVREKSAMDINLAGMGTTLVQMLVVGNEAHICAVGDSRVYFLQNGMEQITEDHVSEIYVSKSGVLPEGTPPLQKMRVLTQAVGGPKPLSPELKQVNLKQKDILLLCSDGLTDMLSDKEIECTIQEYRDNLDEAVNNLIQAANDKGGIDNISVILVEYE